MLSGINKILGRIFVIGFIMPALAFVATSIGLLRLFDMSPTWLKLDPDEFLKDTTRAVLITLILALALMALNRMIFRILEGYWIFDLGSYLSFYQRWRWRHLHSRFNMLTLERDRLRDQGMPLPQKQRLERNEVARRIGQNYPSKEYLVLPTSFGNTVRAFEDYPRVMYGFESIVGWSRLHAVVTKDYREIMDEARAEMDLWMNMWFLSIFALIEYLVLAVIKWHLRYAWVVIPAITIACLVTSWQARVAAEQWGEWVKSAFDTFLPELCRKLGYARPVNREKERDFWYTLSQAITYRDPIALDLLEGYREIPSTSATPPSTLPAPLSDSAETSA